MGKCCCVRRLVVVGVADVLWSGHPSAMLSARVQRRKVGGFEYRDTESRRIREQGRHMRWEVPELLCGTTGPRTLEHDHV